MSAKDCLWAKFRATCPTENDCLQPGMMPTRCIWCGWDVDAQWEDCLKPLSPALRAVEEIIAEEEEEIDPYWKRGTWSDQDFDPPF